MKQKEKTARRERSLEGKGKREQKTVMEHIYGVRYTYVRQTLKGEEQQEAGTGKGKGMGQQMKHKLTETNENVTIKAVALCGKKTRSFNSLK